MNRTRFRSLTLGLLVGFSLETLGCGSEPDTDAEMTDCDGGKCDDADGEDEARSVCVALRGNGERIFGILAGISRVVEEYGLLTGAAGGSSGSISAFLTESVHQNPLLRECGKEACGDDEAAARAALLFKSMQGYYAVLANSDEANAFATLAPVAQRLRDADLETLAQTDVDAAQRALTEILESDDLADLINPEVLETIANSPDPAFHVRDFAAAAGGFGSFSADEPSILIRPGFVDFDAIALKIGRLGTFYAAYEPVDQVAMLEFLEGCGTPGRGLNWPEVAALRAGKSTCGELFTELAENFRTEVIGNEGQYPSRIDDLVGDGFHSLVPTSVLTGDAAAVWQRARENYLAAEPYTFEVSFEDVKFGFFGNRSDLERAEANAQGYKDAKTAKFMGLGQPTWRAALTYSPAEPGIARALELEGGVVSAGGWPDLHPTLALKNIGCDEVVYVSRAGEESGFALGVARLMSASEADIAAIYDASNPESGFGLSLQEADATLCTDWNDISGLDLPAITANAYNAPLETDDPYFAERGEATYAGVTPRAQGRVGCSLPVAAE